MVIEPNKLDRTDSGAYVDPLLDCLVLFTKIFHNPYSREALTAGLPLVSYRLTTSLFVKAAERAGF